MSILTFVPLKKFIRDSCALCELLLILTLESGDMQENMRPIYQQILNFKLIQLLKPSVKYGNIESLQNTFEKLVRQY